MLSVWGESSWFESYDHLIRCALRSAKLVEVLRAPLIEESSTTVKQKIEESESNGERVSEVWLDLDEAGDG